MRDLGLQIIQSYSIVFELISSYTPKYQVNNYSELNTEDNITCNFDYQKISEGIGQIFIDIGLRFMPVGSMLYRTGFEFKNEIFSWDNLFVPDIIEPIVKVALQYCITEFKKTSVEYEVETSVDVPIDESIIQTFASNIIEQYTNYRKPDEKANTYLMDNIGLEYASGNDTIISIICTFIILDEVLYINTLYDGRHNREVFGNIKLCGYWFTKTENGYNNVWYRAIYCDDGTTTKYSLNKGDGFSVRCVKDY